MSSTANQESSQAGSVNALRVELAEHKRAEEEIRQRHRESEEIRKILSAITTHLDLSSILQETLRGTLELTGLEGGTLCLVNFEHQSLELAASINASPEIIADLTTNQIKIGDCLCGQCARDCRPLILWDNASGSMFATREATRNEGLRFHAAFPLRTKERCLGVLCLYAKSDRKPSPRSLDLVRDLCGPVALAIENTLLFQAANREIADRAQAEEALRRTNRTLRMVRQCDQVLVRATEEAALLRDICRIVVDEGGYRMAWVGFAEADEAKTVRPVAQFGFEKGYLETLGIVWADAERGRGPAGTAIRTGQSCVIQNTLTDPRFTPWRAEALKRGYASALGCPLPGAGPALGVLMIYASTPEVFDPGEVELLTQLAEDLAFGIVALRTRAERTQAEMALRAREHLLAESQRIAHIGTWSMAWGADRIHWTEETYRVYGVNPQTFVPTVASLLGLIHPEDRPLMHRWIQDCLAGKRPGPLEFRICSADGSIHTLSGQGDAQYGPERTPICIVGTVQDITERKRAEAALRELSRKNEEALRVAHMGHWELDLRSAQFTFNDQYYTLHGTTGAQVGGYQVSLERFVREFMYPQDAYIVQANIQRALASDEPGYQLQTEARILRADGQVRTVVCWFRVERDARGAVVKLLGVNQDITERKQAEEALQRSQALLSESQAIAHLGSWEFDLATRHLTWSDEVYRIFGVQPQGFAVTYEAFVESIHPEDRAAVTKAYSESVQARKDTYEIEHRVVKRDTGEVRIVHEKCIHLKDASGHVVRSVGMVHDVTERKQAEAELRRHREHLEELVAARTADLQAANRELEAFSYSVSHDLRAPLRALDGYTHILLQRYGPTLPEAGQKMLNEIARQGRRMGQLIDDLLTFSRMGRQAMTSSCIDMQALAQEAFAEYRAANPNCTAQIHPLPQALGDYAMIRVVLNNLFSNAIKYSRNRNPSLIEVGGYAQGPQNVYYIKDNGVGFDMKDAGKLFGVFQRLHSKDEFEGTGVGLALVQRIVQRHGGQVWAESKVDEGATFSFSLPAPKADS